MGERGYIEKYLYFSERRVGAVVRDNGIRLGRKSVSTTGKLNFLGLLSVEATRLFGRNELDRDAVTALIEREIGDHAVSRFHAPPPAQFVKGVGRLSMSEFISSGERRALFHTRVVRDDHYRTDIVLFGSMDNFPGFIAKDDQFASGWTSSAAKSIEIFLRSGLNTWDAPDEGNEALAHEALKVALRQGKNSASEADPTRPHLRGFTIGHSEDVEWFAEVHLDVELDPQRWGPHLHEPLNTERIIIAAPLWIRTPKPQAVVLYNPQRRAEGLPLKSVRRRRHARR